MRIWMDGPSGSPALASSRAWERASKARKRETREQERALIAIHRHALVV